MKTKIEKLQELQARISTEYAEQVKSYLSFAGIECKKVNVQGGLTLILENGKNYGHELRILNYSYTSDYSKRHMVVEINHHGTTVEADDTDRLNYLIVAGKVAQMVADGSKLITELCESGNKMHKRLDRISVIIYRLEKMQKDIDEKKESDEALEYFNGLEVGQMIVVRDFKYRTVDVYQFNGFKKNGTIKVKAYNLNYNFILSVGLKREIESVKNKRNTTYTAVGLYKSLKK